MRTTEQIEKYLNGEMTPEEQISFEQELENDETLRGEFQLRKSVIRAINQVGRQCDEAVVRSLQDVSAEQLRRIIEGRPAEKPARNSRLFMAVSSLAAAVALFLVFNFFSGRHSDTLIYQQYYTAYQEDQGGVPRGTYLDSTFPEAMNLWAAGDKERSISLLEQIVREGDANPYYKDACWYLSLFYIRQHEKAKAKVLLQAIVTEDGYEEYVVKAKEILEKHF